MSVGFLGASGVCFASQIAATGSIAFARFEGVQPMYQLGVVPPVAYPMVSGVGSSSFSVLTYNGPTPVNVVVPVLSVECDLSPFELSASDGVVLSGAVLGVWAAGWAIRMVIRAFHVDEVKVNDD